MKGIEMETELTIDEMIENLKSNIATLATYMNKSKTYIRTEAMEMITGHWVLIDHLDDSRTVIEQQSDH